MKTTQKIAAITLVVLIGAAIYGLWHTRQEGATMGLLRRGKAAVAPGAPLVDQAPLRSAQQLAKQSAAEEERPFAQEALRLADKAVDLAFVQAYRDVDEHPPALSPEAKEAKARIEKSEKLLTDDKAQIDALDESMEKAAAEKKEKIDQRLDVIKAQAELDQDELDEAKQDLIRAGGDLKARLDAAKAEHEQLEKASSIGAARIEPGLGTLRWLLHWWTLHQKQMALWQAKVDSDSRAAALTAKHNTLDEQVEAQKASSPQLAHHGKKTKAPAQAATSELSGVESEALLDKTQRISLSQRTLASFSQQIETEKDLSDLYGQWIVALSVKQRAALHRILIGTVIILAIALIALYFATVADKVLSQLRMDRRQIQSLRTVAEVALRILALLLIVLVLIGPPGQLGTFLGLAGAGLTVALKDFIVGFVGWFVLMGKNGMRLGDWVEINGVTGEVVEIGPFHTVLLETGNWTDSGHPTGRRVTFTNSFAIEGHYFNFSTSGQWLWDELTVVLPSGQDPYPMVEAIQKQVQAATSESATQAESEWRRATGSQEMSSFSVAPAISVKPVMGGIEVIVRYITRANERYLLRSKLYQMMVQLLGGRGQLAPKAEAPTAG
jgi:small-conductance mechanosensitive channel